MEDEKRDFSEVMAFLMRKSIQVVNKVLRSKKLENIEDNLESKEVEKEAQRLEKKAQKIQTKIDKKENLKLQKERNILLREKNTLLYKKLEELKKDIQDLGTGKVSQKELQEKYPKIDKEVSKEKDNLQELIKEITINKKLVKEENSKEFFTRIPYQKDKYLILPKDSTNWIDDKLNTLISIIKSNDLLKIYNSNKDEIGVIKGEKIHKYYDEISKKQTNINEKDIPKKKGKHILEEISMDDINKELKIDLKNEKELKIDLKDNKENQLSDNEVDIEKSLSFLGDTKAITFMELANMENLDSMKEYNNFKALQKHGLVKIGKGTDLASSKISMTKKGDKVLSEIKKLKSKGQVPSKSVVANIVKMVGKMMESIEQKDR